MSAAAATLCRPRRFGDSISPVNVDIYDTSRLLAAAVDTLDRLGIKVICTHADCRRNQRVVVEYCSACDALGGVERVSSPNFSEWTAQRYGIEIRWTRPTRPATGGAS